MSAHDGDENLDLNEIEGKIPVSGSGGLKDCPFCGSHRVGVAFARAGCLDCHANISLEAPATNDDALVAWNRRVWEAEDQKIADAILADRRPIQEKVERQ